MFLLVLCVVAGLWVWWRGRSVRFDPRVQDPRTRAILEVPSLLAPHQCRALIEEARAQMRPATVGIQDTKRTVSKRNHDVCFLCPHQSPAARELVQRVHRHSGLDPARYELVQVARYRRGEYYKLHYDDQLEHPENPRSHTYLVYLNTVARAEGGGTHFPELDRTYRPKQGTAVVFKPTRSVAGGGYEYERRLIHESQTFEGDEKWIATVWVHYHPLSPCTGHS